MAPRISSEVLIVGAGAAGLILAIDLARRNVRFRLIDKAAVPFIGSRGKGIQPRSQEIFEDLGVLDRMAAQGGHYPKVRSYTPEGVVDAPVFESQPPEPTLPYRQPLMLPQNLTEGALRDRLREFGHEPEFGAELTSFDQDEDGVTARMATSAGEQAPRFRYLIGADGGGSFVRRALKVGFSGETLPGRGLVADMRLSGLDRDHWHSWNAAGGPHRISICPLAGTDLFQLQTGLPAEPEPDLSDAAIAELVSVRTGRTDILIHEVLWRSSYRVNARLADHYRIGRVFLAGDAAHVHPPTGGQGLNTSIQDSYALGWRLAAVLAGAPDRLLDTYEAERRPIAAGVLALSTRLLGEARSGGQMRRGTENHELDLGYFDSALALQRRRPGRLRAGARAPDALCQGAGGRPISMFHVFRGPQWTLLGYEVDDKQTLMARRPGLSIHTVGRSGELRDPNGEFVAAYDVDPGDWVLVRPDGYVGAIVSAGELDALHTYLNEWGLHAARRYP